MLLFLLSHLQRINKQIYTSTKAFFCSVIKHNPLKWQSETCCLTEDPPSQTCTCRSHKNHVTAAGFEGTQTVPVLGVSHGWIESFHAHLWVGFMTNWSIKECNNLTLWFPSSSRENEHRSLKSLDCFGDGVVFILQTAKYLQPKKVRKGRELKLNLFIMILGILLMASCNYFQRPKGPYECTQRFRMWKQCNNPSLHRKLCAHAANYGLQVC